MEYKIEITSIDEDAKEEVLREQMIAGEDIQKVFDLLKDLKVGVK